MVRPATHAQTHSEQPVRLTSVLRPAREAQKEVVAALTGWEQLLEEVEVHSAALQQRVVEEGLGQMASALSAVEVAASFPKVVEASALSR